MYTVIRGFCLDIRRAWHDENGENKRSNTMNELQLLLLQYASCKPDEVRRGVLDCGVGRGNVAVAHKGGGVQMCRAVHCVHSYTGFLFGMGLP